jgi:hypothetical protein
VEKRSKKRWLTLTVGCWVRVRCVPATTGSLVTSLRAPWSSLCWLETMWALYTLKNVSAVAVECCGEYRCCCCSRCWPLFRGITHLTTVCLTRLFCVFSGPTRWRSHDLKFWAFLCLWRRYYGSCVTSVTFVWVFSPIAVPSTDGLPRVGRSALPYATLNIFPSRLKIKPPMKRERERERDVPEQEKKSHWTLF